MSGRVNVTQPSMPPFECFCKEIAPLWESRWLTNHGQKHREFEAALADYLNVDDVSLFVNGHSALECVLEAMDLGNDGRNEIITTPFTFASTTHAIVRKGLKPVFADIKPSDLTIDPEKIEPLITQRTCAILPVHVYGHLCDVESIGRIADAHGLKTIYDAAHAFGVTKDGVSVAKYGDAAMFSFHATKVFNTIEGGAVCCADSSLREKLTKWGNFGIVDEEHVIYPGGNAKLNEFAAAMGICNLRTVDEEIGKRRKSAMHYWSNLARIPGITTYRPPTNVESNYAYMPILVEPELFGSTRDDLYERLNAAGFGARKYFYPLTSEYECYDLDPAKTPIALEASRKILAVPLYADLDQESIDRVCDVIAGS